jgi:hypothetical protein
MLLALLESISELAAYLTKVSFMAAVVMPTRVQYGKHPTGISSV